MTTPTKPIDIEHEASTIVGALAHMPILDRHRVLRLAAERASDAAQAELAAKRAEVAALERELAGAVTSHPEEPAPRKLTEREAEGVRGQILDALRAGAADSADPPPWSCGQIAADIMLESRLVSPEIRTLVREGRLVQTGSRRAARYSLASDRDSAEDADESEGAA